MNEANKFNTANSHKSFETILDVIENRLDKLGPIKLYDIWFLCQNSGFKYDKVRRYFERIMTIMVEQKKAEKICNGHYVIVIPNRKKIEVVKKVEPGMDITLDKLVIYLQEQTAL
jgi:hypothetical protein